MIITIIKRFKFVEKRTGKNIHVLKKKRKREVTLVINDNAVDILISVSTFKNGRK